MPKQAACTSRALHANIKPTRSEEVEEFAVIKRKTIVLSWVVNQGNWVTSAPFRLTNFLERDTFWGVQGTDLGTRISSLYIHTLLNLQTTKV